MANRIQHDKNIYARFNFAEIKLGALEIPLWKSHVVVKYEIPIIWIIDIYYMACRVRIHSHISNLAHDILYVFPDQTNILC